jgi:hypothetical protein
VFLLAPLGRYSSEVQQPARTMAILGRRSHPCQTALFDREQDRAGRLPAYGGLDVLAGALVLFGVIRPIGQCEPGRVYGLLKFCTNVLSGRERGRR